MFKKTLLALAVSGVAVTSAQAATIYVSTTNNAPVVGDFAVNTAVVAEDALGTDGAFGGADDNCDIAATDVGASSLIGTAPNIASAGGSDDAVAAAAKSGLFLPTGRVEMTGVGACDVFKATSVVSTPSIDGIEYSQVTNVELTADIVAGLGGYKDEDTITINVSGADINRGATVAPTLTIVGADGTSTGLANVSWEVLDVTEERVRFRLQATDALADFVVGGAILRLGGVVLDSSGLSTATTVSLSTFGTNTAGTDFDEAEATPVLTLAPQYTSDVDTALNARIDVGTDRQQFEFGATSDQLIIDTEFNPTRNALTPETATYKVTGDFSWIVADYDTNEDGKLSSAEIGGAVSHAGVGDDVVKSWALNTDATELTLTTTTVSGNVDTQTTLTFNVKGYDDGDLVNAVIPVQTFTVEVDVQDDDAFTTNPVNMSALEQTGAGAWTLNGSVVVVPYLPFGPNTQPIIRHTNGGNRTGDLSLRYMVEGVHTEWQNLGVVAEDTGPGVRNLLPLVNGLMRDEGYDASQRGFKAAFEFVTNVPSNDVWVFAAAKVTTTDSDRINISTSSAKTNF